MENIDRRFDVIVVGSGAGGSMAVKELTERGLDVLLLEAGRDLTEADFEPPPPKPPRARCSAMRKLRCSCARPAGRSPIGLPTKRAAVDR